MTSLEDVHGEDHREAVPSKSMATLDDTHARNPGRPSSFDTPRVLSAQQSSGSVSNLGKGNLLFAFKAGILVGEYDETVSTDWRMAELILL